MAWLWFIIALIVPMTVAAIWLLVYGLRRRAGAAARGCDRAMITIKVGSIAVHPDGERAEFFIHHDGDEPIRFELTAGEHEDWDGHSWDLEPHQWVVTALPLRARLQPPAELKAV